MQLLLAAALTELRISETCEGWHQRSIVNSSDQVGSVLRNKF